MFLKWIFKLLIKLLFVGKAAVEVAVKDYKKVRPDLDDAFERAESEGQQAVDHLKRSWSRMEADLLEKADSLQKKVMHAAEEANGNGKGTCKTNKPNHRGEPGPAYNTSGNGGDNVSSQASEVNRLQAELAELRVELRALRRMKRDEETDSQDESG